MPWFVPGFEPACKLTDKEFQEGDDIVLFPALPIDRDDPLWDYNEQPMLREAFDEWEHREAFLVHWQRFVRTTIARLQRILIDREDYFVLWGWTPPTIGIYFFKHGFSLFVPVGDWPVFRTLMLKGTKPVGDIHLSNHMQVSVGEEGNKIRIAYKPSSPARGRQDRVLLYWSEWKALKDVLREIDRLLPQMSE